MPVKPIWEKIKKEAGPPPEEVREVKKSPEERAEELWALWQDFRRALLEALQKERQKKVKERKPLAELKAEIKARPEMARIKGAISQRWHDPKVQEIFKSNLERAVQERERLAPTYKNYSHLERLKETSEEKRDELYQEIYKHREKEPEELTLMDLADFGAQIKIAESQMAEMERESPELAARLSFERLREYRKQLQKTGFVWTPSRERFFWELLERATLLNRNRPLVPVGETGTGKTELVRALSRRLTGSEPARTTARDQSDPGRTLGFRSLEGVAFGTLGQALTGKSLAQEEKAGPGKIALIDEANKYPEDFIRMLVKTLAGRKPGDKVDFDEWYGQEQKIAPHALVVLSMNLPDPERGRHLDRPDFSPEVKRELAPTTILIEYIPQTPEDPELFEMLLVAAMDKNNRIRMPKEWLAPTYKEVVDPATKIKRFELDPEPKAGGTLWRFANLIAQSQRLYEGTTETLSPTNAEAARLEHAVLDIGVTIGWLWEYQKKALREGVSLQKFLAEKLELWVGGRKKGGQYLFPAEDREVFHKLLTEYRLDKDSAADLKPFPTGRADPRVPLTILSPYEIGALSPRVPRAPEYLKAAPPPLEYKIWLPDGAEIIYKPEALGKITPGTAFIQKADKTKRRWVFKGLTAEGKAVIEREDGEGVVINQAEFTRQYERKKEMFVIENAVNPFRESFLEGGIPEADPTTAERKEVEVDLEKVLENDLAAYQTTGLEKWAVALESVRGDIRLTPEKRQIIEQEIKDGAIPIFMPGSSAQLETTVEQYQKNLKPVWIKNGKKQDVADADMWSHTAGLISEKHPSLVQDVPERPYVLLIKPSQSPEGRTTNKTGDEQKAELQKINRERRAQGKAPAFSINPAEYASLQKRFTETAKDTSPKPLKTLNPLDANTWIRFINLPLSSGGYVPNGGFRPGNGQVRFDRGVAADPLPMSGFRPAVRVEV